MLLPTQQAEASSSTEVLRRALSLPETRDHLLKQVTALVRNSWLGARKDHEDIANELTQQCLTLAWTKQEQYTKDKGEAGAWLHGFAIKTLLEYQRKLGRIPQQASGELLEDILIASTTAGISEYQKEFIQSVMHQLPELDQRMTQLHVFELMPSQEIAKKLNLSLINTRVRLSRLRVKLKAMYDQAHPEDAS